MAAVAQPGSGGGDVVGGAFAFGFQQHRQIQIVLAVPRGERFQQLQPLRGGRHTDLHFTSALWSDEARLARIESAGGQVLADRRLESDAVDRVGHRIEVERSG